VTYKTDPEHGTKQRYRRGCKCSECREAEARYERHRVHGHNKGVRLRVDRCGSRRRVQALQVMGWRLADIAAAANKKPNNLNKSLRGDQGYIYKSTHDAIAAAYDQLSMKFGPSELTRKIALKRGYQPPLAWDEGTIDDPEAKPYPTGAPLTEKYPHHYVDEVLVHRALAGQRVEANKVERREIARRWVAAGKPLNLLDRIQGWNGRRDLREAS
jgi:hypothetical protein